MSQVKSVMRIDDYSNVKGNFVTAVVKTFFVVGFLQIFICGFIHMFCVLVYKKNQIIT